MEEQNNEVVQPEVVVPEVTLYCHDYSGQFSELLAEQIEIKEELKVQNQQLQTANTYLAYTCGFLLFFVIVTLCVFGYKFIRLFI